MEKTTQNLNALKIKTKQFILSAITLLCLCGTAKAQEKNKTKDKNITQTTLSLGYSDLAALSINNKGKTMFYNDLVLSGEGKFKKGQNYAKMSATHLTIFSDGEITPLTTKIMAELGRELGNDAVLAIKAGRFSSESSLFYGDIKPLEIYADQTGVPVFANNAEYLSIGYLDKNGLYVEGGIVTRKGNKIFALLNRENASLWTKIGTKVINKKHFMLETSVASKIGADDQILASITAKAPRWAICSGANYDFNTENFNIFAAANYNSLKGMKYIIQAAKDNIEGLTIGLGIWKNDVQGYVKISLDDQYATQLGISYNFGKTKNIISSNKSIENEY